jgi:Signal recognition particle 9 kDa protein (SRP9)
MPYLPDLNSYLHQSSLLLQAYPNTTRITTKYSLPRKAKAKPANDGSATEADKPRNGAESKKDNRERPPAAASLTFKTFETTSGICLKYQTKKSAEVGRLMTGLGRLAIGDIIEPPSETTAGPGTGEAKHDAMEVDSPVPKTEKAVDTGGGGSKGKKKKGKK